MSVATASRLAEEPELTRRAWRDAVPLGQARLEPGVPAAAGEPELDGALGEVGQLLLAVDAAGVADRRLARDELGGSASACWRSRAIWRARSTISAVRRRSSAL